MILALNNKLTTKRATLWDKSGKKRKSFFAFGYCFGRSFDDDYLLRSYSSISGV